jgi:hypothetical protein
MMANRSVITTGFLLIILAGCTAAPTIPSELNHMFNLKSNISENKAKEIAYVTMKKICNQEPIAYIRHPTPQYTGKGYSCEIFKGCIVEGEMGHVISGTWDIISLEYELKNPYRSKKCDQRLRMINKNLDNIYKESVRDIKKKRAVYVKEQALEKEKQARLALERARQQKLEKEKQAKLALQRKKEHDAQCQKILQEIDKSSGLQQISLYKKLDTLNCQ